MNKLSLLFLVLFTFNIKGVNYEGNELIIPDKQNEKISISTVTNRLKKTKSSNEYLGYDGMKTKKDNNVGEESFIYKTSFCDGYTIVVNGNDIYSCEDDISKIKMSTSSEYYVVKDNKVVYSNEAIAMSKGSVDRVNYIYGSIDSLLAGNEGTPIAGGHQEAKYIDTHEIDGRYILEIEISSLTGFVNLGDFEILPSSQIIAPSYYSNENGSIVYNESIDVTGEKGFVKYPFGTAPEWMEDGKYYSTGNDTFYNELQYGSNKKQRSIALYSSSYFQNLPYRSTSNITSSQMKSYLSAQNKTSSNYYNSLDSFKEGEELESINALMLFAMANHESAYGTSNLANTCFNFFGRGAFDSTPENACEEYGFTTPRDGILAQSHWLNYSYTDVEDFRYFGDHPGDKRSGINAKYASDPLWGVKIASHAYQPVNHVNGIDEGLYKIVKTTTTSKVYKSSSLNTGSSSNIKMRLNASTTGDYTIRRNANTEYNQTQPAEPRLIVTEEVDKAYQVQLPTAIKISNETCQINAAKKGSYPNFQDFWYSDPVSIGEAHAKCSYDSWAQQRGWIYKSNTSLVENNTITKPGIEIVYVPATVPYILETNKDNVLLFSGEIIKNAKTPFVVNGTYTDVNGNVKAHDIVVNNGLDDIILRADIGYNKSIRSILNAANPPLNIRESATTNGNILGSIESESEKFISIGSVIGEDIFGDNKWNNIIWDTKENKGGYVSNYYSNIQPVQHIQEVQSFTPKGETLNMSGFSLGKYDAMNDKEPIRHYNVLENTETAQLIENGFSKTERVDITRRYKTDGINYTYSGFETINPINLESVPTGEYVFKIRTRNLDTGFDSTVFQSVAPGTNNSIVSNISENGFNYKYEIRDRRLYLTKTKIPFTTKQEVEDINTKGTSIYIKGFQLYNFYAMNEMDDIRHYLYFEDMNNQEDYQVGLSRRSRPDITNRYSSDKIDYKYSGYETSSGLFYDISNIPEGSHELKIRTRVLSKNIDKERNATVHSRWQDQTLSEDIVDGYKYKFFIEGRRIYLTKTSVPLSTKQLVEEIRTQGSEIYIKGFQLYETYGMESLGDIRHNIFFEDRDDKSVFQVGLSRRSRPDITRRYNTYNTNYNYSGYETSSGLFFDISNIPEGSHKLKIRTRILSKNMDENRNATLHSSWTDQILSDEIRDGFRYKFYVEGRRIYLDKTLVK